MQVAPGQSIMIPITYVPRYPCTLGSTRGSSGGTGTELEDYYSQQAPYQIAFSSTFDPDDENFSLAQPPPPKITKIISGTARADWEQLVKEMPPQERSNWLQQQQQHMDNTIIDPNEQHVNHDAFPGGDYYDNDSGHVEWIFEVRTTVLVETSRGSVQLPVRASSRRQNSYGLPDVVYFDQEEPETKHNNKREGGQPSESPHPDDPNSNSDDNSNNPETKGVLWLGTDLAPAESSTDDSDDDREGRDEDEISPNTSRDCYNLFMTNPSNHADLRLEEVFLSRHDQMSLHIQGQLRAPSHSISQWWNTPRRNSTSASENDDESQEQQLGSLILGPGEQRYVVTVCTTGNPPDWLFDGSEDENDMLDGAPLTADTPQSTFETLAVRAATRAARLASSMEHSLGFLHLRTESGDTLYVALERLQKQCQNETPDRNDGRLTRSEGKPDGLSPQASPSLSDQDAKKQHSYPPSYHNALYRADDEVATEMVAHAGKASNVVAPASPLVPSVLSADPPRLDFSVLSSSSPKVVSFLGIRNPKEYPIKIMRSGVAVEIEDETDSSQPNPQELGLHMSVKIKNNYLDADALTKEALMITCTINWDRFQEHNLESLFFYGNAILRATSHVDYNYQQWINNLVKTNSKAQQGRILITNDYATEPAKPEVAKQTEFVLEIPLTVSISQGKIGIMIHRTSHPFPHLWTVQPWSEGLGSVSSIFYPQRAFDVRAELDSSGSLISEPIFGREGIEQRLRIFANIHMPSRVDFGETYQPQALQLAEATITEETDRNYNVTYSGTSSHQDMCDRFSITTAPPPGDEFPFQGFNDVGILHIKYRLPDPDDSTFENDLDDDVEAEPFHAYPTYCSLSFTTEPFTERHQIPLLIYPGESEITGTHSSGAAYASTERVMKVQKKESMDTSFLDPDPTPGASSHALVGFDDLVRWFRSSIVGSSLRKVLQKSHGDSWGWGKRDYRSDLKLLEVYVQSLFHKSFNLQAAQIRPILLKVGAIRHGTVETSSFYMTNHNPVPLLVSVDVGEVEGMSISLARVPTRGQGDGHNILDHFPKKRQTILGGTSKQLVPGGENKGHPLEGLRKFLKTSDMAQQFLSVFRFRDAISMSQSAVGRQPLLSTLYKKYAFGEFHRDSLPFQLEENGWSKCRSQGDSNAPRSKDHNGKGPLLISEDSSVSRVLHVCQNKSAKTVDYPSDGAYTIIPPGAIARFDLKLHAPPKSLLQEDVTRFLSTGLVLSTDHGEIMPIFVTFEALLGDLQVSAAPKSKTTNRRQMDALSSNSSVIQVPVNLFHETQQYSSSSNTAKVAGDPAFDEIGLASERTVPLQIESSFSRDVRLVDMSSCNPWFEVSLDTGPNGSELLLPSSTKGSKRAEGQEIGVLRSAINCKAQKYSIVSLNEYPSFFQCAMNWLASRPELQPRGCGATPVVQKPIQSKDEGTLVHVAEHGGVKRALKAFEKALLISSFAFDDNRLMRHAGDGIVTPTVLDVYAEAWDAWRSVSDYGLRMLTSTLKATIEYDSVLESSKKDPKTQNLSVSMRDTIVATVLATPKLFDDARANSMPNILLASPGDDTKPSTVEFHPTLVADTTSLTIPLRNPTRVPVRVRLAIVPDADKTSTGAALEKGSLQARFGADDEIRESFTGHRASPFVQSGKVNATMQYHESVSPDQLWWDGSGGYFLADDHGDLLRSHHSVHIAASSGAQVSLANPSLHANVALLTGCGVRCGIRDDRNPNQDSKGNQTLQSVSPIGASAAVGITLAGRTRSSLPQANVRSMDEPSFAAGDAIPGGQGGPAAFALPFSALGDIVIPPFGEVEVGPILFRPPGLFSVHGCDASSESRAVHSQGNEEKAKACSSKTYESTVYLENSLSGLERISLRGKAMWEKVVFLDPPPPRSDPYAEDFGDIELRHGRSALMFSGSKSSRKTITSRQPSVESTIPGSVIKEVLVFNDGDTVIDYGAVYLSDSVKLLSRTPTFPSIRNTADACSFKQFRLLNCLDNEGDIHNTLGLQNIRYGFTLQPGQNMSLYVEHFPECSLQREFVAINLERQAPGKGPGELSATSGKVGLLVPGPDYRVPGGKKGIAFRHRKDSLLVGFDMTDKEFKSCEHIRRWGLTMADIQSESRCVTRQNCGGNWFTRLNHRLFLLACSSTAFVCTAILIAICYNAVYTGYLFRKQSSTLFSSALVPRRKTIENCIADRAQHQQNNWSAAFRCLARADPSSADLQALGRDQIRHVVLGRYKSMGILSPQCFNSNGVFNRERSGMNASGSPSRQTQGKDSSASGNDRVRTLSDAIYRHCATYQNSHLQSSLPCGLSWRVAIARGVVLPRASENPALKLRTQELLLKRIARQNMPGRKIDERSSHEHQQNGHALSSSESSDDNSETDNSEEENDDESLNQNSLVSEFSQDNIVDDPENASVGDMATNSQVKVGERNDVLVSQNDAKEVATEEQPQFDNRSVAAPPEETVRDNRDTGSADGEGIEANEAAKSATMATAKPVARDDSTGKSGKKESTPAGPAQRKKENQQETKNERRNRQKTRGKSPVRTEASAGSVDRPKSHPIEKKDSRSKTTESTTTSRLAKGKTASQEKGKVAQEKNKPNPEKDKATSEKSRNVVEKGRQTSRKEREKKNITDAADNKGGKGADAEVKANRRRGNKGELSEARKNTKDVKTNPTEKSEKKSKNSRKKEKKNRPGKVSATESKQGDTQEQPEEPLANIAGASSEPILRPPPGLAPPPGFGGQESAGGARPPFEPPSLLTPGAFLADSSILGSPPSTLLGTPSRSTGESAFGSLSPSVLGSMTNEPVGTSLHGLGSLPTSHNTTGESLLAGITNNRLNGMPATSQQPQNSSEGFDVMDFLDSILDEEIPPANVTQEPSPQQTADPNRFLTSNATALPHISLDPWATERNSSRALNYGIAFDGAGSSGKNPSAGLVSTSAPTSSSTLDALSESGIGAEPIHSIPLLSSAAILYNDDGEEEEDNGDSFYASLLGKSVADDDDDDNSRHY